MSRKSRRLAGLPPVSADEESSSEEKVVYKTEDLTNNGLIYTNYTSFEIAWLAVIFIFFIFPIYLFLANS